MKYVLTVLIVFSLVMMSGSMAGSWKKSLDTDLTITQNSYSDSWTGGEAGSISWVWNANGQFEKALSPKFTFKNTSRFAFGQTHIQNKETKDWAKPEKSTDLIDIENLGLFTLHKWVDPYIGLRFESQFVDASLPDEKFYFSPAKITESGGVAKNFIKKEDKNLFTRLGFALRQIIAQMPDSSLTTNDGGIESVTDFDIKLSDVMKYTTKLSLYKALFYSESDNDPEDLWQEIDVNWENKVSAAVAKYVTVTFYTQLLYDKQVVNKGRFKETLGVGVTYKAF